MQPAEFPQQNFDLIYNMIIEATGVGERLYRVGYAGFLAFGEPYGRGGGVGFRNVGMDVVLLAVATDEAAAQLVHRGVQDPEALVRLGEDLLQRFDLQLQCVQARHFVVEVVVLPREHSSAQHLSGVVRVRALRGPPPRTHLLQHFLYSFGDLVFFLSQPREMCVVIFFTHFTRMTTLHFFAYTHSSSF